MNTLTFDLEDDNHEEIFFKLRKVDFYSTVDQNLNFQMSFQIFKNKSYCVDQKHDSGTKNIVGDITYNKKSGRENKLLVVQGSICNRKKPMIVSNNKIEAESLVDFSKNLGKKGLNVSKNKGKERFRQP